MAEMTLMNPLSPSVRFEPWVGPNYPQSGKKWLILGESHYGHMDAPTDYTQELTENYVSGSTTHRFWTRVARVFLRSDAPLTETRQFWQQVAFYNYVQRIVGGAARQRPSPKDWQDSAEAFRRVLEQLRPTHMLVLGKTLWENMPYEAPAFRGAPIVLEDGADHESWIYPLQNGHQVMASWIYHPASHMFVYAQACAVIRGLQSR